MQRDKKILEIAKIINGRTAKDLGFCYKIAEEITQKINNEVSEPTRPQYTATSQLTGRVFHWIDGELMCVGTEPGQPLADYPTAEELVALFKIKRG